MQTEPASLILTKMRPPALRSRAVQRARLYKMLEPAQETDLVLVCAPAGYGKTTLLAEWVAQLHQTSTAAAWYALDESDNHPSSFGAYLVAGLKQALGVDSGLDHVSQMLRATPSVDLLRLLPSVINAVCSFDREIVLVLDDYHLIRNPEIHQAMEFLIQHRPANLHVALGSRTNPPLPLARLRARGRLVELRAADLRFSEDETRRFLRETMRLDLPDDFSIRLAEKVEGWPAGVQLAALSLPAQTAPGTLTDLFAGGRRRVAEYLFEEVINQLPEGLQSFLLYSSILERMCAPLCDSLLGIHNSADLFEQLEHLNLFIIPLDEEPNETGTQWYRYHHLFRDFLQTWLTRTQPEKSNALHRSASGWFAENGLLREAASHAFRCNDWSFAADFVEQHSFTLIIRSEISVIHEWCSVFPEAVLQSRPRLCVFQALALAYRSQGRYRARVESLLRQANQMKASLETPDHVQEVDEMTGVVQILLAMTPDPAADGQHQLDLARSQLAEHPHNDPGRFSWLLIAGYACLALNRPSEAKSALQEALPLALHAGMHFGAVETTFHLARLAHNCGELEESLEICRNTKGEFEHIRQSSALVLPGLGCLDVAAGCVLLEQNRLEEAEQHLRRGLRQMGWAMSPFYLMTAYTALFHLLEMNGQQAESLTCLDELELLWPDLHWLTQGYRVQAFLRSDPHNSRFAEMAEEWLEIYQKALGSSLPPAGLGPIGALEAYHQANLIWARLMIMLNQPQETQPYLQQHLQIARENGLYGRLIELLIMDAQRLYREGKEDEALNTLGEAVALARSRGYMRVFDQGFVLDELIHFAVKNGPNTADIEPILSILRVSKSRAVAITTPLVSERRKPSSGLEDDFIEPLSERELEVLHMIATGASNQEIAERFVITVGTVKSHVHHIFGKLGVRSRTEAVAEAQRHGLIQR